MTKRIWLLEAEHKTVSGRVQEAHETRASAQASARKLRTEYGSDLDYCEVYSLAVSPVIS